MESCVHLLIIWHNALSFQERILDDLGRQFQIIATFDIHWTEDKFFDNYKIFYAHSLRTHSAEKLEEILLDKINHCGVGVFKAVVFRDDLPRFEKQSASGGVENNVNIRVFEKKILYRQWTHSSRIHASNDAWETNKDLSILFGLNTQDFLKKYSCSFNTIIKYNNDCIGVGGYKNIQQLFYILNNCIQYVVLRNYEPLPDQYTVEGHGDIDMLIEDINYMRNLTLAKKIWPESYRVYHTIMIGGEEIPFDFRYIGDNYYDQPWQEDMLNSRVLSKDLFYIPNSEQQYYSLLYHAYIQKWMVKDDYHPKLETYGAAIGQAYKPDIQTAVRQLDDFMRKHRYEYIKPQDLSVIYNLENVAYSGYAYRNGRFFKHLLNETDDPLQFHGRDYEKEDSFIKTGNRWLIENEAKYLELLKNEPGFPRVLRLEYEEELDESLLEISRVPGVDFESFFADVNHQRPRYIRSFIVGCIHILMSLAKKGIAHRDFLPANIFIADVDGKSLVSVIDFGWAININRVRENRPKGVAWGFRSEDNYTDSFILGMVLPKYWYKLFYVRIVSKMLRSVVESDLNDISILLRKYRRALFFSYLPFSPLDLWLLVNDRHHRIRWTLDAIKRKLHII